jgi:hypothetical protein
MTIVYNLLRRRRGRLKAQALSCSWLAVWRDEARVATGVKTLLEKALGAPAEVIPAVATGRATVYEWPCAHDMPAVVRPFAQPDARGCLSNLWYASSPNPSWGGARAPSNTCLSTRRPG